MLEQLARQRAEKQAGDGEVSYRIGELLVMAGAVEEGVGQLVLAVEQGFFRPRCLVSSPVLEPLAAEHPRFRELLAAAAERNLGSARRYGGGGAVSGGPVDISALARPDVPTAPAPPGGCALVSAAGRPRPPPQAVNSRPGTAGRRQVGPTGISGPRPRSCQGEKAMTPCERRLSRQCWTNHCSAAPRRGLAASLLLVALLPAPATGPARAAETPAAEATPADATPELSKKYQLWLERVETLITDEERAYFLAITEEFRRDAFIRAFWQQRDPYRDTGYNELQVHWEERVDEALVRWGSLEDERAVYFVRHGEPYLRCLDPRREAEVWAYYEGPEPMPLINAADYFFWITFYTRFRDDPYQRWRNLGFFQPAPRTALPAVPMDELCTVAEIGVPSSSDYDEEPDTLDSLELVTPSKEWVAAFAAGTTDLPPEAPTFPADVTFAFPGRHQQRTVVQGVVLVDGGELDAFETADGRRLHHLMLVGELVREDALFESFRYRFELPDRAAADGRLPLVFQRYLRPGRYRLLLKLEDLYGRRFARLDLPLEVPPAGAEPPPEITLPRLEDAEIFHLLAEADAASRRGEHSLALLSPPGMVQAGMVRFQTVTVGDFARVDFLLDGRTILSKRRPPYSVELYLGEVPEAHRLRADGYGADGALLASDELVLNPGGQRFRVHITEPRHGVTYRDSLRAAVQVITPDGEQVERVELFLDEERVATLYQPPYVQPLLLDGAPLAHLRAVAHLADGHASEDSVFINAPGELDEIYVHFVELYASVYDRRGRPVLGLTADDFEVFEEGERQTLRRFQWVDDLPLHTVLLLDTSASMEERLPGVTQAARTFLRQALSPSDRAALIPFNHQPQVAVRFSNDLDALSRQLDALRAAGSTSIYDSLVFALQYFQGIRGQKALLLLSDGEDESSRFDLTAALEAARRAGVMIYAVWLEGAKLDRPARRVLTRLADDTGGRAYFGAAMEDLPALYASILAELRSQYLLGYQSTSTLPPARFRQVEVDARADGERAEVRTIAGYYP